MKKLRRRNLSEVFKTEKASKNLKSKKGHESNVSCVREGRLYRLGNYNFMRFYTQGSDKKNLRRVSEVMTLTLTDQCLGMTSNYMQMVCTNRNGKPAGKRRTISLTMYEFLQALKQINL